MLTSPRPVATDTRLLFPLVDSRPGSDTEITISNASADTHGTTAQAGSCSLTYYGSGAPAMNPVSTGSIPAGQQIVFSARRGGAGIPAAPDFMGYVIANCAYPQARGIANINAGENGSFLQDAQVITLPRSTTNPQRLLFSFVSSATGLDTRIAIANTSADPFGTANGSGACTLDFYGTSSWSTVTPEISPGSVYTFQLSGMRPDFEGYGFATCNFTGAAGVGLVRDVAVRKKAWTNASESISLPRTANQNSLLFPSVSNAGDVDTVLTIANTTQDPYGSAAAAGACALNFYGTNAPDAPVSTGAIAAGSLYKAAISRVAPGFAGYVTASCDFGLARGSSYTATADPTADAPADLAEVLSVPRGSDVPGLLFPRVSSQSGSDTYITITNTSLDPFGSTASAGACTLSYYGNTIGGALPPPQTSASVPAGGRLSFSLANGNPEQGIVATPDFRGYVIADCGFPLARGSALISTSRLGRHSASSTATNTTRIKSGPTPAVVDPPTIGTVTPASGTGATQTFTATYSTVNGFNDLQWVQMLFAIATDGGGQSFCFVHYDVTGNGLWVYGDGGFFVGPVAPGTTSNRLQNTLCALNTSGSSVSGAGNTLTVNANIVFKQSATSRNVYLRAMNKGQADTGWVQRGTWTPVAATQPTLSVSPSSGSGSTQTFTATYPDTPGFAGAAFGWTQFLIAAASDGGGQPFCFVHYDRGGNGLWMYSGDLGFFLGPVTPGAASNALSSSACSVNTASATVSNTGGNLVVSLPITMKSPMAGDKKIFQRTLDTLNRDTGWQQTGTWTVPASPQPTVTTASLPTGILNVPYTSTTLTATGGTGTGYTWSVSAGALPAGLTLTAAGLLSGTPTASGSSTFTVQVKDSANSTGTKQFTLIVTRPLAISTSATLLGGTVGIAYSTTIDVVGGLPPYTYSATGLPAWLSLDTTGSTCGAAGTLCGTPLAAGTYTFSITVTDSSSPTHQSVTQTFSLTVAGVGTITVPSISVGVNLQAPIIITFSSATASSVTLTITSSNPSAVLLGNASEAGRSPLNVVLTPGTSSVQVYIKALTTAAPVTITASADTGYTNGTGTATITNAGFIVAGPNGNYTDFTTFGGVTTGITVYPFRLNGNAPVESQAIRGGFTATVPIAVAPTTLGSMNVASVAFSGGDQSAAALFTASSTNTGVASINVSPPVGSSFVTPSPGGSISHVTIQQSGFVAPTGVTVGKNLQAAIHISLSGAAGADTTVTVASSNPAALKFSSGPTVVGAGTIQLTIRQGFSSTPDFYAQGYNSSGSAQYTISAPAYGTVTTSIPFGPSGFVLTTPGGQGADFNVTLGGPNPSIAVSTALFDSVGNVVALQPVAADTSVTATLASATPSVGTVSPASLAILGGTGSSIASFQAVTLGSTNISATATGYTGASVKATVANVQIFLNPVGSVGKFLAAPNLVNANSSSADVVVTLTSNDPSLLKLALNATDAGSNSITVTIRAGTSNAGFWVFGLGSSGTASYTASTPGSPSVTDSVTLAGSAVVLYMGAPGNPSCYSTGSTGCTINRTGGNATVYAITYQLSTDGTNSINGRQVLAGSAALSVPLKNSNPAAGSAPTSVNIAGGTSNTPFSFTPAAVGTTVVSINNLAGWTAPAYITGFDLTQLGITVQ